MRVSYDSRETFVRVTHDSRLTFVLWSYLCRRLFAFIALCGSQKLNCGVSANGSRRPRDGFAIHAITWRLFCEDFGAQKV